MLGEIHAERAIHGCRVPENLREIWLEEDHVRSLLVALVVLAANATAKIVLRSHFIVLVFHRPLRTFDVRPRSLLGR
jgi:hypothetical protein